MQYTEEQAAVLLEQLQKHLVRDEPDSLKIRRLWHEMTTYRARVLGAVMNHHLKGTVYSGPFKGMQILPEAIDSISAPILLGTYEHELHATLERVIAHPFRHILNIGCAYGFYSVGFARRMKDVVIHAFDTDPTCRRKCTEMAILNGVADRIEVGGEFRGEDFASYANQDTVVFMDIEGFEATLLTPDLYPSLRKMVIIVELHDLLDPTISTTLKARFEPSHHVQIIPNATMLAEIAFGPRDKSYVDPFDKLLLTWENRGGPTPWGVFWPKAL